MKILIDEGLSTYGKMSGIGYVSSLVWRHLQNIVECDITDYSYLGKYPRSLRRIIYLTKVNIKKYHPEYDIVHFTNHYVPILKPPTKFIATIHDLVAFKYPESLSKYYLPYIKHALVQSIRRVSAIITPSESMKTEILNHYTNIDESKIYVCLNGVNDIFYEPSLINNDRSLTLISNLIADEKYYLCVGTIEKRKNILFLLEVFTEAYKKDLIPRERKLVLVGKAGYEFALLKKYIHHPNVLWFDNIDEISLHMLYQKSKALIFPSLYEGFGIPVAEAIVTGIPVIASNISTNIEFNRRHNNQLLLFDIGNKNELMEILSFVEKNDNLKNQLNYGNVSMYNYHNVAKTYLDVYRSVIDIHKN
jgi:glycosyltransferase involved in cell wall biosynthesis